MNKNQKGFAATEIIFVVLIIALLSLIGWLIIHTNENHHNQAAVKINVKSEYNKITWPNYLHLQPYEEQGQISKDIFGFFGQSGQDYELVVRGTYSQYSSANLSQFTDSLTTSLNKQGYKVRQMTEWADPSRNLLFYKAYSNKHIYAGTFSIDNPDANKVTIVFTEYDAYFSPGGNRRLDTSGQFY
ncbi:MAG TPA: hypothetical protein VLF90_01075 [Patescibacteria group bacterium]|nr:hypothetical protein [Patescibacteria group bacterium]